MTIQIYAHILAIYLNFTALEDMVWFCHLECCRVDGKISIDSRPCSVCCALHCLCDGV